MQKKGGRTFRDEHAPLVTLLSPIVPLEVRAFQYRNV